MDIAVDAASNAYVTGGTSSADFPTANPIQSAYAGGGSDAFVAQIAVETTAPHITALSPTSGYPGTIVTVTGDNFGATQGTSIVTFEGVEDAVEAEVSFWSATAIDVTVPELPAGAYDVVVTTSAGSSNAAVFTVVELADGFDYPLGDRGYDSEGRIRALSEDILPERNNLYPDNPTATPSRSCRPRCAGWYNISDVANYVDTASSPPIDLCGLHAGEDWNFGSGTDDAGQLVYAVADGLVVRIASRANPQAFGYTVILKHFLSTGDIVYSFYLHVTAADQEDGFIVPTPDDFPIRVGQWVHRGDRIARLAHPTEISPHLHLEIRDWEVEIDDTTLLYQHDNGHGYYTDATDVERCDGMTAAQVEAAFALMRLDGILDPSDFIDDHRPVTATPCDADGDGDVDTADAIAVLLSLLRGAPLAGDGDCDQDGQVTFADVFAILQASRASGHAARRR